LHHDSSVNKKKAIETAMKMHYFHAAFILADFPFSLVKKITKQYTKSE